MTNEWENDMMAKAAGSKSTEQQPEAYPLTGRFWLDEIWLELLCFEKKECQDFHGRWLFAA
ncbi:MAG: hypothetical protein Q4C66_11375 [Lachnospiraceae bacterium]|nr:hypothetical protein [Lachnospiraceae bacterium]